LAALRGGDFVISVVDMAGLSTSCIVRRRAGRLRFIEKSRGT
jgi:hypothetical protein